MILTDAKVYLAGHDLSGDHNAIALAWGSEEQDNTTFGNATRSRVGGLRTAALSGGGFWNGGADNDKAQFDAVGVADKPVLVSESGDAGEIAYFMKAMTASYQLGGSVGEMLPFNIEAAASGGTPLVRGTVLFNGTSTETEDGSDFEIGAVAAGQKLYAALFVLDDPDGTSPTLDVVIESDADTSFDGSETTRITFAQQSARGAVWATPVSGAITDTFWRAAITIGGTSSPSFRFAVVMGIL